MNDADVEKLETADLNSPPTFPSSLEPARTIGAFRLLRPLGAGGMGEVWLAEQSEPVRRQVALKIIKEGMDTRQVVARFEAERQALAMMNHPAIARVFEAGATPAGRPFFAMEYVPGVPITEHCDRHRLTLRQRLKLITQVCEGVQHAHQKSVIHRDLKPSNVLVTLRDDQPEPKIIDFGIAKATGAKLTETTIHTQVGALVGTPAYMSPEQADMTTQDIDTRTDVYSLGVMLYELLVGALPHDPDDGHGAGYLELTRRIREDDVPKPSTRLSLLGARSEQLAMSRRTTLSGLRRDLSGDLDWIILKALEKDRGRRYASPQDLAADIERHLTDRPVLASPPSTTYQVRKFVQRHTWGVMAAASAILMLTGFAVVMTVQAERIAAQRDVAEQAKTDLESVVGFQAGMLSATDPEDMGRRLMTDLSDRVAKAQRGAGKNEAQVASGLASLASLTDGVNSTDLALGVVDQDILGRAVETLDAKFKDRPLIAARLRGEIGSTYRKLGRFDRAEAQLKAALDIQKQSLGADHEDTLEAMNSLAGLYFNQGRFSEAEALFVASFESRRRVLGEEHQDTLKSMNNLGAVYMNEGRVADAERILKSTLDIRMRSPGPEHQDTLMSMNNLATLYASQHRLAEAEPLFARALEVQTRVLGEDHADTRMTAGNLANVYADEGKDREAERLYVDLLRNSRRLLGDEHPDTLDDMANLASVYLDQGRLPESERLLTACLGARRRVIGVAHPSTLNAMNSLASVYLRQSRLAEADALLREALGVARTSSVGDEMASTLARLAQVDAARGHRDRAMEWLRQSVDAGFADGDKISEDSFLRVLHGPEFDDLVKRARDNAARQRA
jgi:serine/threonine protein kinase/tetratricopeptide (TPR) repeat protein